MRINEAFDSNDLNPVLEQSLDDAPPLDDVPGADDEQDAFEGEVEETLEYAQRPMWQNIATGIVGVLIVGGIVWGITPKMAGPQTSPPPPPPNPNTFDEGEWL